MSTDKPNNKYGISKEKLAQLNEEREFVIKRLELTMGDFYENPSEITLKDVLGELIHSVIYQLTMHVALVVDNNAMTFEVINTDEFGWVYTAYTDEEELAKSKADKSAVMTARKLFERVAKDDLAGVIINPHKDSSSGALLFIRKENAEQILKYADDVISKQPEGIQKLLMED